MARQRLAMALIGLLAGASLYLLTMGIDRGWLEGRLAVAATLLAGSFFAGLLAMAGPLSLARAAISALGVAVVIALLFTWAGLRFDGATDILSAPIPILSLGILTTLPLPFLIAEGRDGWRDYPTLFGEAWAMFLRVSVAVIFVGLVWGVIYLSDALLNLVGVPVIEEVIDIGGAPWLITGTVLGLALAVVLELSDKVTPYLVLRLLRLLVPVVLVVLVVFIGALPFRGLEGLFGGVSVAAVLIAVTVAAATLVTAAVDQDDDEATDFPWMRRATQMLALVMLAPAGLACWAVWLRVWDHGWTPDRLLAASLALIAVGYGLSYLAAVVLGRGWMERIRQANIWMALGQMIIALLWLTPVLNPEAIASRDQLARIEDGRTKAAEADLGNFQDWGRPGAAALARVGELAADNPDLAKALAALGAGAAPPPDPDALKKSLAAAIPLQPPTPAAAGLRDQVLAGLQDYELQEIQGFCDSPLPQGGAGCVMVAADLLPALAGDEALLITRSGDGYMRLQGFALQGGLVTRHEVTSYDGELPLFDRGAELIASLQRALPPLEPQPLNRIAPSGLPGLVLAP